MNLFYINLGLEYETYSEYENELRYQFQLHTRYISNYFSRVIRKYRFKTDGTFNMISIDLIEPSLRGLNSAKIDPFDVLAVEIPFDRNRYERIKGSNDCDYYLELLEQGFIKASKFKLIPLETLLGLIKNFKVGGCKNEWLHKKKRFKSEDLVVALMCEFTTNYFQLVVVINQLSTKKELVKGVVLKTEADEVVYEGMFKDIIIDKNIIITDKTDSPRVVINKEAIFNEELEFTIKGDYEMKKMLSYNI